MLLKIHIGCNDVFSPQCVSKCDFSEKQVEWLSSCTVCIFEAFSQSGFFCGIQKVHESMRKSMRAKYAANKFLNYELFREVNSRYVFPAHQGWSSSSKSPSPSTPGFARSLSFTESIWWVPARPVRPPFDL